MATVEFSGVLPPVEEFVQQLRKAEERYDPVEKLLDLGKELTAFEQKYSMSSIEFFRRFESGEMGDAMDYFRWVGRYEAYLRLRSMISPRNCDHPHHKHVAHPSNQTLTIEPAVSPHINDVFHEIDRRLYPSN